MSITTVDDYLIHYEALGRGEPLIFIHGWLGSWRYWWPSMQELSLRHRTFAFDLWGFGDSSKAQSKYSFEAYMEMVGQFADNLGISRPFTLIGHALGAAVALRYAAQHPDDIKRLVVVALPIQGEYIHDRLTDTDSASFITRVIGRSHNYPEVDIETRKTDNAAVNQLASQLKYDSFGQDLEKCVCPVLLVFGNQDVVVQQPVGDQQLLPASGNNRLHVTLEGCNHFPMLEQTAKFNRLLLDFIHAENDLTELAPKEHWQRRTR